MKRVAFVIGMVLLLPSYGSGQSPSNERDASADFDFLLGTWSLIEARIGTDPVQPRSGEVFRFLRAPESNGFISDWVMNRGTVTEPDLVHALYVTGFDRETGRWNFYYLSDRSAQFYDGRPSDTGWHFYREYRDAGNTVLQRQSWRPSGDDGLLRLIEDSRDGGTTWVAVYEARFRRQPPGP